MANFRRGPSTVVRSSSRRKTEWTDGPESSIIQSVTAGGSSGINTGIEAFDVATIVRIRGELMVWLEAVGTVGDGFTEFAAGIGIVSTDAFDAGAVSIPSPILDKDWGGWMWYTSRSAIVGLSVTESDVVQSPLGAIRIPIDTKAMRKIEPNNVVVGVIGTRAEVGVATLSFQMSSRMLFKLH